MSSGDASSATQLTLFETIGSGGNSQDTSFHFVGESLWDPTGYDAYEPSPNPPAPFVQVQDSFNSPGACYTKPPPETLPRFPATTAPHVAPLDDTFNFELEPNWTTGILGLNLKEVTPPVELNAQPTTKNAFRDPLPMADGLDEKQPGLEIMAANPEHVPISRASGPRCRQCNREFQNQRSLE